MPGSGTWWAEHAWLGGDRNAQGVLLGVKDGVFTSVTPGVPVPPAGATTLRGITVPGFVNAHSHAFHRVLRARTHESRGTFWSWRDTMYHASEALNPDLYFRIGRAVFAEMLGAGFTTVGEFHYVHHGPGGRPYEDGNEMGNALLEAASQVGIRITLIDACYLSGGFNDAPLEVPQQRFADKDASSWADRVCELRPRAAQSIAAALHSVRAVPPEAISEVSSFARERGWPLHAHVSEQRAEVEDCIAASGRTPIEVLESQGALSDRFTAVHATHAGPHDAVALGASQVYVCACATTERDLGDGLGPFALLRDMGCRLCVGSDSNAVIDAFEEVRSVEMNARLSAEQRAVFSVQELLRAATSAGMESLGWPRGGLDPGLPADLVTVRTGSARTAGCDPHLPATALYAAAAADVDTVIVDGETVVRAGSHTGLEDPAAELAAAAEELWQWRP
jgi:formiminoglutamate deiminase